MCFNSRSSKMKVEHEWEIPYEELVFETKLGEGTYGVRILLFYAKKKCSNRVIGCV